ncbi:MAG TPA: chemotaxis protein CheW [Thermoanaerobaculia bacterium]|nr:chemotaxis protein CheW [Thermoanaerobaculia bacterium]
MSEPLSKAPDCWNEIGVWSPVSASCPVLKEVIHCHNCDVFAKAGRDLLERQAPGEYLREWTVALERTKETVTDAALSLFIFRVGREWLALPASALEEVTELKPVRTLPHRTGGALRGLVNIRGEIELCFSLSVLLGIEAADVDSGLAANLAQPRMMVVRNEGDHWVFAADEVWGSRKFSPEELTDVPVTVARDKKSFTRSLVQWRDHSVGILDDGLLFYALRRRVFG